MREHASWGDAIRAYENSKKQLPWSPDKARPADYRRITKSEMSRKEREWDPILTKFRTSTQEDSLREREMDTSQRHREMARKKQMIKGQAWDILTNQVHRDAPPLKTMVITKPRRLDSRTPYNILSNIDRIHEVKLKTVMSDEVLPIKSGENALKLDGGKVPRSHLRREYDVLSNRYYEDHDFKTKEDLSNARTEVEKKFCKTHDLNLITGCYYDHAKEEQVTMTQTMASKTHGKSKLEREPPSYQIASGHVYNIISNQVKNEKMDNLLMQRESRATRGKQIAIVEKQMKAKAEKAEDIKASRSFNRISYKRFEPEMKYSHDLICHVPYQGEGCARRPPPQTKPPLQLGW